MTPEQLADLHKYLPDPLWRLQNLYTIVDKDGSATLFKLNYAQKQLYENIWFSNVILKARQLGISTFVCLYFLDICLFRSNVAAGIIAHTREDAEHIFKRIKFAYDKMPDCIKSLRTATTDSAREMVFNNNSSLRVGTSMRGSTLQYLHISEFGKICSHYPDKAREIITGSLNTVANKQYIFIESTAEGKEGAFYDICQVAQADKTMGKKLSPLDYRFHFFPWYDCKDYEETEPTIIPKEIEEYFESLRMKGINLSVQKKSWYYRKLLIQKDDQRREYPSTPEEAFESSVDGSFYAKWIGEARFEGRIGTNVRVPWDREARVCVAFDPGMLDSCAIVFWQNIGQEIHVIDYYENSGEGFAHYLSLIKSKPYLYDRYFGPHDIENRSMATRESIKSVAAGLGVPLIKLATLNISLDEGINVAREIFPRVWIDAEKCDKLIKCLENYKKEYDPVHDMYKNRPVHNKYSHGADAFRYAAIAIKDHIDSASSGISDAEAERMYNKYHPRFE